MKDHKTYRLFSYAQSFKVKVCLPAILRLAVVHLQSDPFQACISYINSGLTNAIQKSSRCPKNPTASAVQMNCLSTCLHRWRKSIQKILHKVHIHDMFSCWLSANGSVHSIHHSDTICEIKLSFILSLELVPCNSLWRWWSNIQAVAVYFHKTGGVFDSTIILQKV